MNKHKSRQRLICKSFQTSSWKRSMVTFVQDSNERRLRWAQHLLYSSVACWRCRNVCLFTALQRIAMALIAFSEGCLCLLNIRSPCLSTLQFVACVKNTGNAPGSSIFLRWESRLTSWTLNTQKDTNMLVGKFMVTAFSALLETRVTLFGLVSVIVIIVTQFKKEEVKTRGQF